MGTCGSPTRGRRWESERGPGAASSGDVRRGRWLAAAVAVLLVVSLTEGCAPTSKIGSPPRTDRLGALTRGVSTAPDVLLALGEPRGRGAMRRSTIIEPRTIWLYEYTEAGGGRVDLTILLVFFHQERYDGHLWFSSVQLLDRSN